MNKYTLAYPSSLNWTKRFWTLKEGDHIKDSDHNIYLITSVNPSPIPGELPTILYERINEDQ